MKLPLSWLSDYTNIDNITPKQYADALTMSGSKVEGFEEMGAEIQNVVVGKIVKKEKHPNADTLWVCQVDIGEEVTQIITGAQNIEEENLVPVALHGAKLPGGINIKAGKLRGEKSNGMMCSHGELGLGLTDVPGACEDGIIILQQDYKTGTDIKEVLGLSESIIEFEITSNRPDCLSVIGLARETAVTFDKAFNVPKIKATGNSEKAEDFIKISVTSPDLCPRYTARVVKNIKIEESPKWLRDRLTACGVRPINNIVDITNYVMLEYGQPMHAFDKNFLSGGEIIVRRAIEGEKITTLDGEERNLTTDMLVIADAKKAVAVAGVMGGENSEINENTKEIVFESANFDGSSVRLTAKKLGMRTEASARFEKGLDPETTMNAVNRACELIEALGAGEVIGGTIDVYNGKKEKRVLPLEIERTNAFLGADIDKDFYVKTLTALEFSVDTDKMEVKVPTFRNDIECFADIAEEIARIYGYNNIPSTLLRGEATIGQRDFVQMIEEKIANALTMLGCFEVMTYSFTHPKSLAMINRPGELEKCIKISNPLGEENSIMRNNMIHSLLEILAGNYNQRTVNAKVFEIGKVYLADKLPLETIANEPKMLAIGGYGNMDFFDLKGIVEELFEILAVEDYSFETETEDKTFHPGKTASIYINGKKAGVIGEIHPSVSENYEIEIPVYMAQIELEKIVSAVKSEKQYKTLNRFPATSRDIAMLVPDEIRAAEIEKCIKKYGGKLLEEVKLFDVYKGKQIPEGKKSMAYSATFRAADRTLNENDVNRAMDKILKMLAQELSAELR